jgi:PAS domain S-box-containing protein
MVMITDNNGTIEYVNPIFSDVTDYAVEEAIGKNPRFLQSGNHPRSFYQDRRDTMLSGKTWQGEFCNRKKNGNEFWESTSISAIKNDDGDRTHFVAVKQDVTERKHMEEEMRQNVEELERFNKLAIGREIKMIQLKEEVNALLEKVNQGKKYKIIK